MLKAKNIIYGFCTFTNPPKNKYLISLYRSETLNVVAVFPTSRKRSGSLSPKHGKNYRGQDIGKHSDKYIFYTLRFDCSFAAANTIKPQLL